MVEGVQAATPASDAGPDFSAFCGDAFARPAPANGFRRRVLQFAWWLEGPFRCLARHALLILIVAGIAVTGAAALRETDASLARMHTSGAPSYTMSALTGATSWSRNWQDARETWQVFRHEQCAALSDPHACRTPGETPPKGPSDAITLHMWIDLFMFAWPAAFFIWLLLWRIWRSAPRPELASSRTGLNQALALALVLPILQLLLDILEDVLARWYVVDGHGSVGVLTAVTFFKWFAIAVALIVWAVAASDVVRARLRCPEFRNRLVCQWRRVIALRAQIISVLLVALLLVIKGDLGAQIVDVILRWQDHPSQALFAFALLVVLTATIVVTGCLSVADYRRSDEDHLPKMSGRVILAIVAVGAVIALLGNKSAAARTYLVPLGVGIAAFGLLSVPDTLRGLADERDTTNTASTGGWPLALAALVPSWVVAILLTRTVVVLHFQHPGRAAQGWFMFGIFSAVAIGVTASGLSIWLDSSTAVWGRGVGAFALLSAAGTATLWGVGIAAPLGFGKTLASLAIIMIASLGALWSLFGLTTLSNRTTAVGPFAFVGFRRVPWILILVAFSLSAGTVDKNYTFHDVRLENHVSAQAFSLREAWTAWRDRQVKDTTADTPLVLLATAGGGIRSAYWTAVTVGCILGVRPSGVEDSSLCKPGADEGKFFLASGVSGGSVGLVATFAGDVHTAARHLRNDFVSPTVARLLLFDSINAMLRLNGFQDRAAVLEQAWENAWRHDRFNPFTASFFKWQRDNLGRKPILLLNGATVDDACRMAGSALDTAVSREPMSPGSELPLADQSCTSIAPFLDPGTSRVGTGGATVSGVATTTSGVEGRAELEAGLDPALVRTKSLVDLTCGREGTTPHDLRMSTAALLSARFPLISPSGVLYDCIRTDDDAKRGLQTNDADGGVIETSGAKPLEEIWSALAPLIRAQNAQRVARHLGCIVPRLIMLDNQYANTARSSGQKRQLEPSILFKESRAAGRGLTSAARQEAAIAFNRFFAGTCPRAKNGPEDPPIAYLFPIEHPGIRAPLGWTLSDTSASDLDLQLTTKWNRRELGVIRNWFPASPEQASP
jgi:hypothetical protein